MLNIVVIFLAVAIDQLSKLIISSYNDIHIFPKDIISDFLRFTYITNDGIAFGLNPFGKYSFILLIVSIIAVLFVVKILIVQASIKNKMVLTAFSKFKCLGRIFFLTFFVLRFFFNKC